MRIKKHRRRRLGYSWEKLEARVLLAGDLVAHWVADDLAETVDASHTVSIWTDKMRGIEAVATGKPTLAAGSIGSRASVDFEPADEPDFFVVEKNDNPVSAAHDFTISVVFQTDSKNLVGDSDNWYSHTGLVDANSSGITRDWGISINQSGQLTAGMGTGSLTPAETIRSATSNLNDNSVHVVDFTRSANEISLYVDGIFEVKSDQANDQARNSLPFNIGSLTTGKNPFDGNIAEVLIYDGALNAEEVAERYMNIVSPVANGEFFFVPDDRQLEVGVDAGVLQNDSDYTNRSLEVMLVDTTQNGSLDLNSDGSFTYVPHDDFQSGVDIFTYRATDGDETSNLATATLIINSDQDKRGVVINELHTNPDIDTDLVEFIEIHNSSATPVRLSGWYFGSGVNYVFPEDAKLEPNGYYVVTQNQEAFTEKFGFLADGQFEGRLRNEGETIELRSDDATLIDRVDYQEGFPWPTVGDEPGYSMELINPQFDNQLGGNWRSSIGNQSIFSTQDTWRYFKGTQEPSGGNTNWTQPGFDANAWDAGVAPIGFSSRDPIATSVTDMRNNYSTIYFRKEFEINDPASVGGLQLRSFFDDGVNVWINGTHVASKNASSEQLAHDATADGSNRGTNPVDFELDNPSSYLVPGTNVIAVQLLNQSLNSGDAYFDATLLNTSNNPEGPSPGRVNSIFAESAPPRLRQLRQTPQQPTSVDDVTISIRATDPDGVANVNLEYQIVKPGEYIRISDGAYHSTWTSLPMHDDGTNGDVTAGDSVFTTIISSDLHQHRHLVRYRINASDATEDSILVPYADDPQPNFAYFVYDGIPEWTAEERPGRTEPVTFSAETMNQLQTYHLIADPDDVQNSQYVRSFEERRFSGTMVFDGQVYDHIEFRVRGEFSTYQAGKNKWKFFFNRGHGFEAKDNYGNLYAEPRRVVNFSSAATPWVLMNRGMAGLGEAVAYRLYELAGNPSPSTNYLQFRVIDDAEEAPENQYAGDLWGLYLSIEHPDGRFLDERGLPDGTTYKVESAQGDIKNQGPTQPDARRDFSSFMSGSNRRSSPVEWWRENLDLQHYFTFRAVNRAVNNMDIRDGWNHYLYHNPETNRWSVIPWDLDMLYVPSTHWSGVIRQQNALRHDELEIEYENRARELQDLLFSPDQVGQLVDEYAGFSNPQNGEWTMVDVDRFMWNYNPRSVNGHRGAFDRQRADYNFARGPNGVRNMVSGDHEGFAQWIKDFMTPAPGGGSTPAGYGADFLNREARDNAIPETPTVTFKGGENFPVDDLQFETTPFQDPQGADTFGGLKWRIAEVTDPNAPLFDPLAPPAYEVRSVWESEEFDNFESQVKIPAGVVEPGKAYRVRARLKDDTGRWSHWSDPIQFSPTAVVPQSLLDGLRVSEIHFNPADPTTAEIAAGHTDNDDFEFVEVVNIGSEAIDLTLAAFRHQDVNGDTEGIEFEFRNGLVTTLGSGERVLVVEDLEAFATRYGDGLPVAGQWSGRLSNSSELISLFAGETLIQQFTYTDDWYPATDGDGFSLEFIAPAQPDLNRWNIRESWQPSRQLHGSPGTMDAIPGDSNHDGIFNSADLILVFQAGEYEDAIENNSSFEEGDWNRDGDFTTGDLVFVFEVGNFDRNANALDVAAAILDADLKNGRRTISLDSFH